MKLEVRSIDDIKPYENNPRGNDDAVDATANSIKQFGWQQPIVVDNGGIIVAGHTRYKAAKKLGLKHVPVVQAVHDDGTPLTDEEIKAYRLADNKTGELADWNFDMLDEELDKIQDIDMSKFGFDDIEDDDLSSDFEQDNSTPGSLERDFMVPPFSVLDTKQGNWQKRKKQWLALGIKSEIGRGSNLAYTKSINSIGTGTSIFDPVLTEIIYKWFLPSADSNIYDPFAGGSVRGIVAATLGHNYTGIDLRKEQIEANYDNAKEIGTDLSKISWNADNSLNADKYVEDDSQDLVIACPPYLDLEQYSDDPQDLSNMSDEDFDKDYQKILGKAVAKLKDNRFAVIVVSDVRGKGKNTGYRDLTGMTKNAMKQAGCCLYNEIILLNAIGTAVRARNCMRTRKVARVHQDVLVFYKGDTSKIKDNFDEIDGLDDVLEEFEGSSDEPSSF